MRPLTVLALLLVPCAGPAATQAPEAYRALALPEPAGIDLEAWREHLRPGPDELERIAWVPSFAEGLVRADRERRPLLFWAMNGHPLACT